jgi:subtilisin family serine protease
MQMMPEGGLEEIKMSSNHGTKTSKLFLTFFCALVLLVACTLSVQAAPEKPVKPQDGKYAKGNGEAGEPGEISLACAQDQVLVKFKTSVSAELMTDIAPDAGIAGIAREITSAEGVQAYVLDLKPEVSVEQALAVLRSLPNVEYAEPNYVRKAFDTPSEPGFSKQWGFNNTGQYIDGPEMPGNGKPDADIDATEAWDIENGTSNPVTVAIIDSGIDEKHPDLGGNVWNNTDEVAGNRVDDDGNGYVDDAIGYNWPGITQPYINDVPYPWHLGEDSNTRLFAQSIVGTGQYLSEVGIVLAKTASPSHNVVVSVRNSLSGTDLASFAISPGEVTGSSAYFYKSLSSTVMLSDGVTYYLVFRTNQNDSSNYYSLYDLWNKDIYGGGCEWQHLSSGWRSFPASDFCFETNSNGMPRDDNGHGTHCAGIVGAESNGVGVIGTSRGATIMPLKAGNCYGNLMDANIIGAIYYAADNGADIISMSFGGTHYSSAVLTALDYALNKGVTLFAAAGNTEDSSMQYPAGYDNVIGVGATDFNDAIASFSTHNSSVDISAPGVDIYSTLPTYTVMFNTYYGDPYNYAYCSGTSMATPMAAGLGALVLARNPSYNPTQVQNVLQNKSDDLGSPGRDDYFGYGRINAYRTLNAVPPAPKITWLVPTSAKIGVTINIIGERFGATRGASYVSFGTTKATNYVFWSDTLINCKVPAGVANIVNVSVTTATGKSYKVAFNILPHISNAAPSSGTPGTLVTITGTGFGPTRGTSYVKFGSTKVTNYVSWSAKEIVVTVPFMAPASINIRVTTKGGTSAGKSFTVS